MKLTRLLNKQSPAKRLNGGRALLNIGCGQVFHPDWTNIDLITINPLVKEVDIRRGLPYPDNTFDVVYHSHILEHLDREEVIPFLKSCFRVTKPGGIIRIATPDLEQIMRNYSLAMEGDELWELNYDWMMLELLDQTVRKISGGEMGRYLSQPTIVNEDFVISRIGSTVKQYRTQTIEKYKVKRLRKIKKFIYFLRVKMASVMVYLLFGRTGTKALSKGLFRQTGEIHHWMYDRFSIKRLLLKTGYNDITFHEATTSNITYWKAYTLDSDFESIPHKPDSLYVEAIKS